MICSHSRDSQAPWSSPSRRLGLSTRYATCRRRTSGAWSWIWRRWRCRAEFSATQPSNEHPDGDSHQDVDGPGRGGEMALVQHLFNAGRRGGNICAHQRDGVRVEGHLARGFRVVALFSAMICWSWR